MNAFEPLLEPDTDAFAEAIRAQALAAEPQRSAWVAANAGSGKTKVLIDRVARLLLDGAAPDSILCITYTKAAANEMLSRLFERLGKWSVASTGTLAEDLARLEGRPTSQYSAEALRSARALFARALETPGGLRIETIHAFCNRVLRRFPLEAGLPPGFGELEEAETARLQDEAIAHALERASMAAPDALERVSLEAPGKSARAALDAAFGKAQALLALDQRYDGDWGALVAALRQALRAPEEAPDEILQRATGPDFPTDDLRNALGPLHLCGKRDSARTAGAIEAALATPDPAARWSAYSACFFTSKGELYKRFANAAAKDPLIADLFGTREREGREVLRMVETQAALTAARAVQRTIDLLVVARPAIARFQLLKRQQGALDFDDLIAETRTLLTRATSADWVLYKLDGGLTHVLLDEAQDTSPDQWALINALTGEFFAGAGSERHEAPRTLFIVGDEKQSIYSFQGADPEHFLTERQRFFDRVPDGARPDMLMSFRSSPEVLRFVDAVFDTDAFDGAPFSLHPPPEADPMRHTARRASQPGRVEVWPIHAPAESEAADPWDAPLDRMDETAPKARLAAEIASEVQCLVTRGETVWAERPDRTWQRRPLTPGDVLILVRSRQGGLFDALINALKCEGLPVAGADRLVLTEHIGVQDCLNLMRFALLPEDDLTLAEILRGPFCNLVDDDRDLFPLAYGRGRDSLWSRLRASAKARHQAAAAFLEGLIGTRARPPYEFLSRVLDRPLFDDETGWDRLTARLGLPVRDPVDALIARAIAFDRAHPASLQGFVAAMEADDSQIKRDLAEPDGAIRIMTVHGAKGLQAPLVILPDTTSAPKTRSPALLSVDGLPVWAPRKGDDGEATAAARQLAGDLDLREHRRLLYVALTRAQDRLIVCGAWSGGSRSKTGCHDTSWYALCAAALDRLPQDGLSEDTETGRRRFGPPPPARAGDAATPDANPPLPGWLTRPAPAEPEPRHTVSPSGLLAAAAPVIAPLGEANRRRRSRGRLIHTLLERLPDMPREERTAWAERHLARIPDLDAAARADIAATALATLSDPDFADIFAPGGRAEAPVIGWGPGLPPGTLVNGRIDRLSVTATAVHLIDFKTDRPPPATPEGVDPAYLAQMAAYRAVVAALWPDRPVRCWLGWTDGPRLMALPGNLLSAQLNRLT